MDFGNRRELGHPSCTVHNQVTVESRGSGPPLEFAVGSVFGGSGRLLAVLRNSEPRNESTADHNRRMMVSSRRKLVIGYAVLEVLDHEY